MNWKGEIISILEPLDNRVVETASGVLLEIFRGTTKPEVNFRFSIFYSAYNHSVIMSL